MNMAPNLNLTQCEILTNIFLISIQYDISWIFGDFLIQKSNNFLKQHFVISEIKLEEIVINMHFLKILKPHMDDIEIILRQFVPFLTFYLHWIRGHS